MSGEAQLKETILDSPDTDLPVGEILRRARLHYGQTLAQVESVLRIKASQLEAIEEGDIDKLPGRVYAIGFVRAYAEYLGLDGNKVVGLFKNQAVGNKTRPELSFPVTASESKLPNRYILIGSFAFLIITIIGWVMFSSGDDAVMKDVRTISAAPVIEEPAIQEIIVEDPVIINQPETIPEAVVVAKPSSMPPLVDRIVINITESSWVEIREQETDKIIVSRVLLPGDSYIVPDDSVLVMDTGNAGGMIISVNGRDLRKLGNHGDVLRGVVLNAESLRKRR